MQSSESTSVRWKYSFYDPPISDGMGAVEYYLTLAFVLRSICIV